MWNCSVIFPNKKQSSFKPRNVGGLTKIGRGRTRWNVSQNLEEKFPELLKHSRSSYEFCRLDALTKFQRKIS
ncbi:hypothetical protein CH380_14775 [Leptospira adleri]|uniref:Uncharacterized protein n=1 Tax=Leptospira adleri TaxID=2023186 RepID=A0A2M9YLK3_9LEPT|nr:hypothetical protein CH380_14775 [Leptospira adleri]PJZ63604.1 hypothetical protein CH376_01795 [Leptospira adleri]